MQVTPAQLTELLSLYVPKRLPVLITGRPGIGKSDIVEQTARATDHELLISHPVVEDPTDSKGLPFPSADGTTAKFLPFGDLERAMTARRPLIWFLDDLGQASPAVQAAKMQLLLARRVGEHVLPPQVTFLAATNRRTDNAGVSGILDPVISRFATLVELEPTIDDWTQWAVRESLPPALIAFLRFRPDLLSVQKVSRDIENTPNPRSWGFVARTMDVVPKHLEHISYAGSVGEGAATELVAFLADLPRAAVARRDSARAGHGVDPDNAFGAVCDRSRVGGTRERGEFRSRGALHRATDRRGASRVRGPAGARCGPTHAADPELVRVHHRARWRDRQDHPRRVIAVFLYAFL